MVDGSGCQCALRPLIAGELRDFAAERSLGRDVDCDYHTFAWLELCVNDDRTRRLWDSIIAEGS